MQICYSKFERKECQIPPFSHLKKDTRLHELSPVVKVYMLYVMYVTRLSTMRTFNDLSTRTYMFVRRKHSYWPKQD